MIRLAFLWLGIAFIGCGAKTDLDLDVEDAAPVGRPEPCEQLQVIAQPQTIWAGDGDVGFSLPVVVARGDGFDLLARRSDLGHPHVHGRRLQLTDGGTRFSLGDPSRVLPEVHDNHQAAAHDGRVTICSGADPGGPIRVLLRSYRGSFSDRVESELSSSSSCGGLVQTPSGFAVAYVERVDGSPGRGWVASLDAEGRPIGDPVQPLADMEGIEGTIRIGALQDGHVWLKRNLERDVFFVGVQPMAGDARITRYEVDLAALYLRAERWPLPDGAVALSYIHTEAETMSGTATLVVTDDAGRELRRHEGTTMSRAGFIEPSMTATTNGLVRIMPDARDDQITYNVQLFGLGAQLLGDPLAFVEPGFGGSRTSVAEGNGLIVVVWDRRAEGANRDEIAGAVLRCGAR